MLRVELCSYDAQSPDEVLGQPAMAAELCALVFARLDAAGWARDLLYNFSEPGVRDLAWVGRHTVHEGRHHFVDVVCRLELTAGEDL